MQLRGLQGRGRYLRAAGEATVGREEGARLEAEEGSPEQEGLLVDFVSDDLCYHGSLILYKDSNCILPMFTCMG